MSKKEHGHSLKNPDRRAFLQFLGKLAAVATIAPPNVLASPIYLPDVRNRTQETLEAQQERLMKAFGAFFPDLETVTINDEQDVEHFGSVKAMEFWLARFKTFMEKTVDLQQRSGIATNMYQDTVENVTINYVPNIARTISGSIDGVVTDVEMLLDAADASGLAAELIHPFQKTYSLEKGVSAIASEGTSTAIHLVLLRAWYEHNTQSLAHGAEHEAVVMPIVAEIDGTVQIVKNPSVSLFNQYLTFILNAYDTEINNSEYSQYKNVYLGEDQLGQSTVVPRKLAMLQRRFDDESLTDAEYQQTIEQHGSEFAKVFFKHGLSLEQAFILSGLINHGLNHTFQEADPAITHAYEELQQRGFILTPDIWRNTVAEFSQITVEDLRINSAFALKEEPFSGVERLTLEAFMVLTSPEADVSYFDYLTYADTPSAKLFFQIEENGQNVWYSKDLGVSPHQSAGRSVRYAIEVPRSVTIRDGVLFRTISLDGKDMVVEVTQDTLFDIPFGIKQSFEIRGEFSSAVAAVSQIDDEVLEPVAAPEVTEGVVQTAQIQGEVHPEILQKLRERIEKANATASITR